MNHNVPCKPSLFHKLFSLLTSVSMISSVIISCATSLISGIDRASAYHVPSAAETLKTANKYRFAQLQDQQVFWGPNDEKSHAYELDEKIGDLDMFVYGLLISEYQNYYEVFNAAIELSDGTYVYGIGYTDFDSYIESEDGHGFFPAGFIPLIGEPDIPVEEADSGIEIVDIDQMEIGISFVLSYDILPFREHCIIWNQYLQYGINDKGRITYSVEDYVRGHCNEELGALYSYDEQRFVFNPNVGQYQYITGQSLYTPIDYATLEAEVNRILTEQDFNFSMVEVQTAVYFAQETFTNYLLSLQEESFMGYPVSEIIEIAEQLDPMELIRFTPDGHVIINIADDVPDTADALTKWLTGISCVMLIGASIALKPIAPLSGAISAVAIDVFIQVVIENHSVENINWKKVAVSAISGATIAWICPMIAAGVTEDVIWSIGKTAYTELVGKLAGYTVQAITNGFVSGITNAAMAVIDEKSKEEIWDAFLFGAAIGGTLTIISSGISEAGNALMINKISPWVQNHPNNWFVKAANSVNSFIGKFKIPQIEIKDQKIAEILRPKSVYQAAKMALDAQDDYLRKVWRMLPNNDKADYFDLSGNPITKDQVKENGVNCIIKFKEGYADPTLQEKFIRFNSDEVRVINGRIDLSNFAVCKIDLGNITSNRAINYDSFAEILAKNPSLLPPELTFTEAQLANLDSGMVLDAIANAGLTPHEGADGIVYLVDTYVHSKFSHAGGVALAETFESIKISVDYLKWLTNETVSVASPVVIADGVY